MNDYFISPPEIKLVSEMLGYEISNDELIDCIQYCMKTVKVGTKYEEYITAKKFHEWWNSDRLNPNLQKFKDSHQSTGTLFG